MIVKFIVPTVIKMNIPAMICIGVAIFDFVIMMVIGYKIGEVGSEGMIPVGIADFSRILALHFMVLVYAGFTLVKRIN